MTKLLSLLQYNPVLLNAVTSTPFTLSIGEVATVITILVTLGGLLIKYLSKSDEKLTFKLEQLDIRLNKLEKEAEGSIDIVHRRLDNVINKISEDREKEAVNRDKAIEKLEGRMEKLSDLIIKLIEKN